MPRPLQSRTARYVAVVVLVFLGAAAAAYSTLVRPLEVVVASPETNVAIQVYGLGTVEARILSKVGFELAGRLAELAADHGDSVKQGAVLARLDTREIEARLAQAHAAVIQAEATLAEAGANVEEVQSVFGQADQTNRRRQALVRQGTVSSQVAEEAQLAVDVAGAKLNQAKSRVEVARANVEQARATAQLEATILAKHTLRAPYDALIVTRHRELGTAMTPGEPLFTLIDPATVWALAHVDESSAGGLRIGQRAEIRLRSLPDRTFSGEIARIDIEGDRVTEERRVYIACDAHPNELFLGEQAEALITVTRLPRATLVPQAAIEGRHGASGMVWAVKDGHLTRHKVTLGHRTLDGRIEITDGLPAGAAALVRLEAGLLEGRAIKVVAEQRP